MATVTTIGTATGYVFFAPETHAARTTVTGDYLDPGFIDEFHTGLNSGC
jgi:hypothetical protein